MSIICFLGGARSGKSALAETRALAEATHSKKPLIYLATATAHDDTEMLARIERHKTTRNPQFQTIEEPLYLAQAIKPHAGGVILLDSVGIWLGNMLLAEQDWRDGLDALLAIAPTLILVSDDVSGGIIPDNALARRFRDEMGLINQQLAAAANEVIYVTAGIATHIKGSAI